MPREWIRATRGVCVALAVLWGASCAVAPTPLPDAPDNDAWRDLFNGRDLAGWTVQPPDAWYVTDDGLLTRRGVPRANLWTVERFGDFVLDLEFKIAPEANSGVFVRTDHPKDFVQTGIEVQVLDSFGKPALDKHDCGAIYDALEPTHNALRAPGLWNRYVITCRGPRIQVDLNGVRIIEINLDRWDTPHRNPDGTANKFRTALCDMPREGHIGLQEHNGAVWYRNIRLKRLD